MDHPQEEIGQHINTQSKRLFEVKPTFISHCQYDPFQRAREIRSNAYPQQNLLYCYSCRIILVKTPFVNFEKINCCITCFANIFVFPANYQICNVIGYSLFDQNWKAEEELQLLVAIEKLGYGNWNDIEAELGHKKKASEIESHYQMFYANHAEHPFVSSVLKPNVKQYEKATITHKFQQEDQQLNRTQKRISIKNSNFQQNTLKQRKIQNQPLSYQKLIGYSQKRDQFQIQFDNQLELMIAEMEFTQIDTQETKQLKMNILKLFSQRLDKRYKIKDFVMQRRLLDLSELNQNEKKKKKEEKELIALLKPFALFCSQEQMEVLTQGLLRQSTIRKQIVRLKDKGSLKNQKISQKQSSRSSSMSTGLFDKNNKNFLKKQKNEKQKKQCWFLGTKEIQICNKYGIDFIAFTFIKETIRSINAIQGKINPEEYFYSIFRLTKVAIHQICQNIQQTFQVEQIIDPLNPQLKSNA